MEHPFAVEYTVSEYRLKSLVNLIDNGLLKSDKFTAIHASGVKYFLQIYPNGSSEGQRGKTWIFLQVELGDEKKVEAEWTYSIKSANWTYKLNYAFCKNAGWGISCCTLDELLDSNKKFFADSKFILKVEGIFKVENVKSLRITTENFGGLWNIGYEDFTIVADKKDIKVHKNVLAYHSPVFGAMFNCGLKEAAESKMEIIDFSFETVEKAIKICYNRDPVADISIEESFSLLKFADKYDMKIVQGNLESYLIEKINLTNVSEIANCAVAGNALKLQNRCMDFLIICLSKKEFVPDMETLEKSFQKNLFINFSCRKPKTL